MKLFEGGPSAVDGLDHEVKYILPAASAAAARALLAGVCRPEAPHAASVVETVYFDDPGLGSLAEKRASDYLKTKVRLRWYDGRGPVWLEIKRRVGSRRDKARLPTGLDGAELGARGLAGLAGLDLARLAARSGVALRGALTPAVRLRYRRDRFVEPASGLRLSLDREIRALERAPGGAAGPELGLALVELKGSRRELPGALIALAALGARRVSFSKYFACFASDPN
jgi:hypothetical protein